MTENSRNEGAIHIGEKIRQLVNERQLTKNEISAYLGQTEEVMDRIYESSSIDIQNLIKLSDILNYNLFTYYFDYKVTTNLYEDRMIELNKQIHKLINQLEIKDEEIARLRTLTETQRKTILLFETMEFLQPCGKKINNEDAT